MNAQQLIFDLEPRPALDADDFLVADCNAHAVGWIDRHPDWPATALIIAGEPGSGKTHLAAAFMEAHDAALYDFETPPGAAFDQAPALVIDDADKLCGDADREERLFHLFNTAKENGCHLLMTATQAPARWGVKLPDLSSRLRACPVAEISAPDEALLGAIIVKQFHDRQLSIEPDVLSYAVTRMDRTFTTARRFVSEMDARSLAGKRRITVPLAREVLQSMES